MLFVVCEHDCFWLTLCIVKMNGMQVMIVVAALDLHALETDEHAEIIVVIEWVCNYKLATRI